ncbi:SusC/RagA family TonB-linked outer membrane protein [uncultured Flavobacterium sp.]|uniref:SusC/RagA family TonB-linked outer membrane protein n=1 Tax=uncultured Flavobacterium sp. TaxID=165435 RepID=UPI0025FCDF7F|nr:SusC/RagA family TonB-linked outer membrane protein [uncultured Flavobacterium sp.]
MKNHSLLGYGHRIFCTVLVGCALCGTRSAFAHSPSGSISSHLIIQQQVAGTVSDASGVLAGVTVSVKGTAIAALSDAGGRYAIAASKGDVLVFSFLGYSPLEMAVEGTVLDALLAPDVQSLQEVTVNAGYYSVKEKERTGSIAKIGAKDIETQPVSNVLAAMQGRMAGVSITQSTGTPGGGFSIQIRGINSIRSEGNDPLYIVNGVPFSPQSLGSAALSSGILPGQASPLNSLNPQDIESIEVLKDADATAIYGSRGANGVVLITTKKGKSGRTQFSVHAASTAGSVTRKLDVLNTAQYLAMREEGFANDGIAAYPASAYDVNGTWDRSRDTDWQEVLLGGTSHTSSLQASVSGGTERTQFLLSGTRYSQTGVTPGGYRYGKGAAHASLSHRSEDDRFQVQFSADYSGDKNTLPGIDLTRQAYTLSPNAPALHDASGGLNWENGTFKNPLSYLEGSYENTTKSLSANAVLSYTLLPGLVAKASAGYADLRLSETRLLPHTMNAPSETNTSADSQLLLHHGLRHSWIAEPQLSWDKKWGRAAVILLAGASFQSQVQEATALSGLGFASNSLIGSLAAAATATVLEDGLAAYRYTAVFGRLNYSWDGRYIANLTGRRDGSSRFGPGKRFANFGAAGAAWIFSREPWLEGMRGFLDFGKLRGSYGVTGSDQIGDYQYLDTYAITPNIYDGAGGLQPARLFNPSFGWETSRKLEAALELGFLRNRLSVTAAWFRNRSSSQLVGVPLPGTTGFATLQANLGATVQNTGIELELRTENFRGGGFSWTTTLNLTLPKNELLEFPGLEGSTYASSLVVGHALQLRRLYHFTGTDPATGNYTFEDFNGDGQLTAADDRESLLDTTPDYYGGLGNQLSYKSWELDFLFQFVKQQAMGIYSYFPAAGTLSNQPSGVLEHAPKDGAGSAFQEYTSGANAAAMAAQNRYTQSDGAVDDASYVRLKSVSLSYRIPAPRLKSFSGRIYLQGQNLLTLTDYNGADPENQSVSYLPPLRQLTLGVQLTF